MAPRVLVVAGMLLIGTACAPAEVGSTPPPPSSPSSSENAQEKQAREDTAAAARAVVESNRIVDETFTEGGQEAFPAELEQYADPEGDWYELQLLVLEAYKEKGERYEAPGTVVEVSADAYDPNRMQVFLCIDSRERSILDRNSMPVRRLSMVAGWTTVDKSSDGTWLVSEYQGDGPKEVNQCADGK